MIRREYSRAARAEGRLARARARGNLTSDGSVSFGYSSQNQLVSASGGMTASLGYDPAMRLYQVTRSATTTRFAYDGVAPIALGRLLG